MTNLQKIQFWIGKRIRKRNGKIRMYRREACMDKEDRKWYRNNTVQRHMLRIGRFRMSTTAALKLRKVD